MNIIDNAIKNIFTVFINLKTRKECSMAKSKAKKVVAKKAVAKKSPVKKAKTKKKSK